MQRFMGAAVVVTFAAVASAQMAKDWPIHDETRPMARVVDPGPASATPAAVPSDAVVLFDGKDLSKWKSQKDGGAAAWKVENGYFEVDEGRRAASRPRRASATASSTSSGWRRPRRWERTRTAATAASS